MELDQGALSTELLQVLRAGLPTLPRMQVPLLAAVAEATVPNAGESIPVAIEKLLQLAIDALGDSDEAAALTLAFGLAGGARSQRIGKRYEKAAERVGINARTYSAKRRLWPLLNNLAGRIVMLAVECEPIKVGSEPTVLPGLSQAGAVEAIDLDCHLASLPKRPPKLGRMSHRRPVVASVAAAAIVIALLAGFGILPLGSHSTVIREVAPASPAPRLPSNDPPASGCLATVAKDSLPVSIATSHVIGVRLLQALPGATLWSPIAAPAAPGDTLRYLIEYANTSKVDQHGVTIRTNLAPGQNLVIYSTCLYDATNPNGVAIRDGDGEIDHGGIAIGNFGPGATAFITFATSLPGSGTLACGETDMRTVAAARATGTDEFYNTSQVSLVREC